MVQTENFDKDLLEAMRVDTNYDEPILNQVLRIAVYDEFHAYETYAKVIERFGPQEPFVNIIEAERRHYEALIHLLNKYNVPVPINNWKDKIEIPNSILECCEVGVAAEIDNIKMYDNLIQYSKEYPDVLDTMYRLQAASYNNHLPAFRQCVMKHSIQPVNINNIYEQYSMHNIDEAVGKMDEFSALAQKFATGQVSQEDVLKMLSGTNLSFIGGALIGAVGVSIINEMTKKSQEEV